MADFKTHLIGAAAISGVVATALMIAGVVPESNVMGYFVLGTVGGVLPDIDAESSVPYRVAFNILGVMGGFLAVMALGSEYSLVELFLVWLLCFVALRFGVCTIFSRYTVHRGLVHSIPAAALFAQLALLAAYYLYAASAFEAWMIGAFIFLGFIVHLLLDEIYSVDLLGTTFKRSFGSAFNLGSLNNPFGTAMLYLAVTTLFFLGPHPDGFLNGLAAGDYANLLEHLLPSGRWFEGLQTQLDSTTHL